MPGDIHENELAAFAVLDVEERELVGDDAPLDEALHADGEAVGAGETSIAVAGLRV